MTFRELVVHLLPRVAFVSLETALESRAKAQHREGILEYAEAVCLQTPAGVTPIPFALSLSKGEPELMS